MEWVNNNGRILSDCLQQHGFKILEKLWLEVRCLLERVTRSSGLAFSRSVGLNL